MTCRGELVVLVAFQQQIVLVFLGVRDARVFADLGHRLLALLELEARRKGLVPRRLANRPGFANRGGHGDAVPGFVHDEREIVVTLQPDLFGRLEGVQQALPRPEFLE